MVQIPAALRPYATALQKFHFWILAALPPLVLLPLLFMGQASIANKIKSQRGKIEDSFSAVEAIFAKNPHPNEKWAEKINARARAINADTMQVWEQLWKAQEPLRQWPESFGNDFVQAASSLTPSGTLRRSLLERYQNGIRPVVRLLPARMGADERMSEAASDTSLPGPGRPGVNRGQEEEPSSLVQWSREDQQALFTSFDWEEPPSTTQVVMAQEELWMYGVLCDVIRNVNNVPVAADPNAVITPMNIAIPLVQELKVGYPAAEDDPGGQTSQRILRIQPASEQGPGGEMPFSGGMTGSEGAPAGRPPHPRFGRVGNGPSEMGPGGIGEMGANGDTSPDAALKNWVYVDLDGKPLTATDLATVPAAQILTLMPFVLRTKIDQRALDRLLIELASAPVPIDIRQVRINADQSPGGDLRGRGRPGGQRGSQVNARSAAGGASVDGARLHDVNAELRGTLAIVMPPDRSLLEAGEGDGQGEVAE